MRQFVATPTGRFLVYNTTRYLTEDLIALFADVEAVLPPLATPPTAPPLIYLLPEALRYWHSDTATEPPRPFSAALAIPVPIRLPSGPFQFVERFNEPTLPDQLQKRVQKFILNRYVACGYAPEDFDPELPPARSVRLNVNESETCEVSEERIRKEQAEIRECTKLASAIAWELFHIRTVFHGGELLLPEDLDREPDDEFNPERYVTMKGSARRIRKLENLARSIGLPSELRAQMKEVTERIDQLDAALQRFMDFTECSVIPAR